MDDSINEFKEIEGTLREAEKFIPKDPFQTLEMISGFVVSYFSIIGFYNVFWRYLTVGKKLSETLIQRISRERDFMANLYPHLDDLLLECGKIIGSQRGFDGDLIRSFTLEEMRQFIKKKKINSRQLSELVK